MSLSFRIGPAALFSERLTRIDPVAHLLTDGSELAETDGPRTHAEHLDPIEF
jgi:hypothetical protein